MSKQGCFRLTILFYCANAQDTYQVEEVIQVNSLQFQKLIEEKNNFHSTSARSPVPEGTLYSNTTAFDVPYYNISMG